MSVGSVVGVRAVCWFMQLPEIQDLSVLLPHFNKPNTYQFKVSHFLCTCHTQSFDWSQTLAEHCLLLVLQITKHAFKCTAGNLEGIPTLPFLDLLKFLSLVTAFGV